MTNINFVDETTRRWSCICAMLEGVHSTRWNTLFEAAFGNSAVIGGPSKVSIAEYWNILRRRVLKFIKMPEETDKTRILIDFVRRRLIPFEDLYYMMKSKNILFHEFPPFKKWSHYEMFLDILELVTTYIHGQGKQWRSLMKEPEELFFPTTVKKSFEMYGFAIDETMNIHKMHSKLGIARRRGMFLPILRKCKQEFLCLSSQN